MQGRRIAEAPDGVGRHVRAHCCGLCTCKSHGRAVVEEVRGTTEGKRFVSGLFPEEFEEFDRLAMGEDVFLIYCGWSLLETREAKLKWGGEIGAS